MSTKLNDLLARIPEIQAKAKCSDLQTKTLRPAFSGFFSQN